MLHGVGSKPMQGIVKKHAVWCIFSAARCAVRFIHTVRLKDRVFFFFFRLYVGHPKGYLDSARANPRRAVSYDTRAWTLRGLARPPPDRSLG